ncbi:glycine receptor subunit alpha-2-like [Centruroides vittatus]|uniref:glycine receptor subunit alpha-2-like n=1 Tax=Centruroides vittatus TaxID=120091 RepID=UPI003510A200
MDFRLIVGIISIWKDPRLKLSHFVSDYPVIFPNEGLSKIWIPEFTFPNCKYVETFDIGTGHSVLKVLPDGSLYLSERLNFIVSCPMELHDFPMDIQRCSFIITFRANTDREAVLKWMGESNSPYRTLEKVFV